MNLRSFFGDYYPIISSTSKTHRCLHFTFNFCFILGVLLIRLWWRPFTKNTRFDNQPDPIELKWFEPSMGSSCCENCSDGEATEGSDHFTCGPMEDRSHADVLVVD
jgi:hypothetical protein